MISNKLLFYGPKGCGKSMFASATFNEFSKKDPAWINVEIKKAGILESPFERLKKVFSSIGQFHVRGILIEDIDLLLTGLLTQPAATQALIEGVKELGEDKVLISTTRNPRAVVDAILSQFDVKVPFYYPSEVDRLDILRVHTQVRRQINLEANIDLSDVAKRTPWFSGADLENIIIWAYEAVDGEALPRKTIDQAIDFVGSSISVPKRIVEMKEFVEFALDHCTINAVRNELLSYAEALNILTPSHSSTTEVDLNKILELKPNFCGLGLNINEIIEAIRRLFRKKKDKK